MGDADTEGGAREPRTAAPAPPRGPRRRAAPGGQEPSPQRKRETPAHVLAAAAGGVRCACSGTAAAPALGGRLAQGLSPGANRPPRPQRLRHRAAQGSGVTSRHGGDGDPAVLPTTQGSELASVRPAQGLGVRAVTVSLPHRHSSVMGHGHAYDFTTPRVSWCKWRFHAKF